MITLTIALCINGNVGIIQKYHLRSRGGAPGATKFPLMLLVMHWDYIEKQRELFSFKKTLQKEKKVNHAYEDLS